MSSAKEISAGTPAGNANLRVAGLPCQGFPILLSVVAAISFLCVAIWITLYQNTETLKGAIAETALTSMNLYHAAIDSDAEGHGTGGMDGGTVDHAGKPVRADQMAHGAPAEPAGHDAAALEYYHSIERLIRLFDGAGYPDDGFLSDPLAYMVAISGLGRVPEEMRAVWEASDGSRSMGELLREQLKTCNVLCSSPNLSPTVREELEAYTTQIVVGGLMPRLQALRNAASAWQERALTQSKIAVAIAFAGVFLSILTTRLMVVGPLLSRLDKANSELTLRNTELEQNVTARTADLTRALADANVANETRTRFLANVNHELRTPMNGVLGVTALLRRTDLTDSQVNLVDTITNSGKLMLRLINDVLEVVCDTGSEMQAHREPVAVDQLLSEAVALLRPTAEAKGLDLTVDVMRPLHGPAELDADRFVQIINNLVGNAIKFTPSGWVSVRLKQIVTQDVLMTDIKVLDSGPGIGEADLAKIFDPFERADATAHNPGSGLGLAVTKSLVERMDGRIKVTSTPGEGTCFVVRFVQPIREPVQADGRSDEQRMSEALSEQGTGAKQNGQAAA